MKLTHSSTHAHTCMHTLRHVHTCTHTHTHTRTLEASAAKYKPPLPDGMAYTTDYWQAYGTKNIQHAQRPLNASFAVDGVA